MMKTMTYVTINLINLIGLCTAEDIEISIVQQDGRRIELSVPCRQENHPVPGPYQVDVVLPLNYTESTEAYRVLYVFDGFDISTELDALEQEGLAYPAILVSIHNRTYPARLYDTTPTAMSQFAMKSGGLEDMRRLIVEHIHPYLTHHYRTLEGPEHIGVVGHSLAGLAALWLGYVHPEDFGLIGCMQPSLWWDDDLLLKRLQQEASAKTETRIWIMAAELGYPGMWRMAKQAAYALAQRGWQEGDDLAFYQVHNGQHGWDSCKTQLRDMLGFLLRKHPLQLIDTHLTNCHGPQHQPLYLQQLGEWANAYLDLDFSGGLRCTAIAPELQIVDPHIAQVYDQVIGQIVPVGPGWTTIDTVYQGHNAHLAVQGFPFNEYPRLDLHPTQIPPTIDGDLSDWAALPYQVSAANDTTAGFQFGLVYDANFVYLAVDLTDETWIYQDDFPDPLNQDGLEILLDARPDPLRSLGRGEERYFDFLTLQIAPGKSAQTMKLRRLKDKYPVLPENLSTVYVRTKNGYQAEVAIPTDSLDQAQQAPWQEFRLNLCQIDTDDPNQTPNRLWWQTDWQSNEHVIGSGTFKRIETNT